MVPRRRTDLPNPLVRAAPRLVRERMLQDREAVVIAEHDTQQQARAAIALVAAEQRHEPRALLERHAAARDQARGVDLSALRRQRCAHARGSDAQ